MADTVDVNDGDVNEGEFAGTPIFYLCA